MHKKSKRFVKMTVIAMLFDEDEDEKNHCLAQDLMIRSRTK